ncbi:MAG TPA: low temperature requirement protein A [Ruania sp.]|nr:low temperature requirement protein A [Ruania sp.]
MSEADTPHQHRRTPMLARDPEESNRASTPLELLFDLTIVVAFAQAATLMSQLLSEGHIGSAILGFAFAVFAICWAWVNYSWLASAFDNDDWLFRLATMVQMVGVLILALGLPPWFSSIDSAATMDNSVVVAGYVVMRLSTIWLWLRVARHNPRWRRTARTYAGLIAIAQVAWIIQIVIEPPMLVTLVVTAVLILFEMSIPIVAERNEPTPWHPHHVAERYSLLIIITLGEVVSGTITSISAVVTEKGWTAQAGLVTLGGVALALGLWWVYFTLPWGHLLARRWRRAFVWGYGHMALFGCLAATGAGLQVAASVTHGSSTLSVTGAMLSLTVPVALFLVLLLVLYCLLRRDVAGVHIAILIAALAVLVAAIVAVALGANLGAGILVTALATIVVVLGYETVGQRPTRRDTTSPRADALRRSEG